MIIIDQRNKLAREYRVSLVKRFTNVVRSNLNAWLDKAEDPQKMIDQAILDMQEQEKRAKRLILELKAMLAVAKSKLSAKKPELFDLESQINKLKDSLMALTARISQAKNQRKSLFTKIQKAKLRRLVDVGQPDEPPQNPLDNTTPFDTYDRMVEKIENSEAQAEALSELTELEQKELATKDIDLEKFKNDIKNDLNEAQNVAQQAEQIENELEELKKRFKA